MNTAWLVIKIQMELGFGVQRTECKTYLMKFTELFCINASARQPAPRSPMLLSRRLPCPDFFLKRTPVVKSVTVRRARE